MTKVNLIFLDMMNELWHKRNVELNPKNLTATFKHGRRSILDRGYISTIGVGNLFFIEDIMDKNKYLKLLKKNLI